MRNIAKTAIALTIAASAIVAASAPSFAQSKNWRQQADSYTTYHEEVPRDRGAYNS